MTIKFGKINVSELMAIVNLRISRKSRNFSDKNFSNFDAYVKNIKMKSYLASKVQNHRELQK